MTTYKPGDVIPREELQEGMHVRVEFEGVAGPNGVTVGGGTPYFAVEHSLRDASRIVLLEVPDPDAEIVEALAETRWDALPGIRWHSIGAGPRNEAMDAARKQLALLREKGYLT